VKKSYVLTFYEINFGAAQKDVKPDEVLSE
jgi:hypothetical protein